MSNKPQQTNRLGGDLRHSRRRAHLNDRSVDVLGQSLQDYFESTVVEPIPDDLLALVEQLADNND